MSTIEERIEQQMDRRHASDQGRAPGPQSVMWDTVSDMAFMPFATCVVLMQTAHPDIGAAIAEYSAYKHDLGGRLTRTLSSLMRFMYGGHGGAQSRQEAVDLRKLHSRINGARPDGTRYSALDPRAYRIVPDTILDAVVRFRELMGEALDDPQKERLYGEYVDLCLMLGLRRSDIEPNYREFLVYYDDLVTNQMTYNDTTRFMLEVMYRNAPRLTQSNTLHHTFESIFRRTAYPAMRLSTVGFMDPRFRDKHGIPWSTHDQLSFARLARALRVYRRTVPRWARSNPYAWVVMSGRRGSEITSQEQLMQTCSQGRGGACP